MPPVNGAIWWTYSPFCSGPAGSPTQFILKKFDCIGCRMSYVLILVADQDQQVNFIDMLRTEEYKSVAELESSEGVAKVMRCDPSLVVMSEDMHSIFGVELLRLLRRLTASPIIVVGGGGETAVVDALLQGADMYISRPINYRELLSRIREYLRIASP